MTNEEISGLSAFELNKAIAEALNIFKSDDGFGRVRVWDSGMPFDGEPKDYCNNWNDLMPLCDKFNVTSSKLASGGFHAFQRLYHKSSFETCCHATEVKGHKRARAECLLKVLIAKENDQ